MGQKEPYTIQQGQMQRLPDSAAGWAPRGWEADLQKKPWTSRALEAKMLNKIVS